jgi:hydrogenase maturation factor HypF (carbamoyltransferase family)
VIRVVPPNPFEADRLFERIAALREGSDRLVANYQKAYPEIAARLEALSGDTDIFTVVAMMLGLEDESFEGISAEALRFLGKGGIQIDTRVEDNRFDNYAFLASIMSYQLGTVESALMCYSIYESFGDYISEIVTQLLGKTKADAITFSGETFANQALFARIERHLGMRELLFPRDYPIGKECAVHGGIYL